MRTRITAIVVLLFIITAAPCFGWGAEGHRIIGDIAMQYMSDSAKAAVKDLLGEQSLADASNWADEIRKDSSYDWAKPLHYINVPRDATRINPVRDCKDDKCVVGAIKKYADVLRDKNATREKRVEALKFLIHFVGDVHQPLHVSYADDRGGNSVKVSLFGQPDWNLHSVWDDGLIKHWTNNDHVEALKQINEAINDRHLKKWRGEKDVTAWANESLEFTRRLYRDLPVRGEVDEAYFKKNIPVVKERLAQAGVRMAVMLNDIFSEPAKAQPPTTQPAATQPASTKPAAEGATSR